MDKIFSSVFSFADGVMGSKKEEEKEKKLKKSSKSGKNKEHTTKDVASKPPAKDSKNDLVSQSSDERKTKEENLEEEKEVDMNFCKTHNEKCIFFCKEEAMGLCNKCKQETHHATTHHVHLVSELSKWVMEEFYKKMTEVEDIKQALKSKEGDLVIPERSFTFGLDMISHVFDNVVKEIEKEKLKIMEEFKAKIEEH